MRNMGFATAMALVLATSSQAQVYDSTGQPNTAIGYGDAIYSSTWERISGKPETAMRWPTWEEVTGKPASASRWPSWNEVTGKPSTFPPTAHNHDDRYVRKGASGAISGNLSVSGTVTGNRLVTGDVGGDRWCRANTSGRIQCTHSSPIGGNSCAQKKIGNLVLLPERSHNRFYQSGSGLWHCDNGTWRSIFSGYSPPEPGRSCFVAGTPILMADGSLKPIEEVKVGDRVSSAHGGINVVRFHDRPIMRPGTGQKLVSINGGDYFMSNNHPVLTKDGWKAVWPEAAQNEALDILEGRVGQLAAGDVILGADGTELMTVETIDIRDDAEPVKLYNFVLDGDHTFVANGFAVHAFEPDRAGRMPIVNEHPDEDDFSLRPWNAPEGMVCTEGWNRDEYNPKGGIACWWWPTGSEVGKAA